MPRSRAAIGTTLARLAVLASLLCLANSALAVPPVQASPAAAARASQRDELEGVSCTSPATCMAVGERGPVNRPVRTLAESWTGGRWHVLPTPSPVGVVDSELLDVSCSGPARCVAVGFSTRTSDAVFGLVQVWNGRTWRALRVPGASSTSLQLLPVGVSCLRNGCLIVGDYAVGPNYPLAMWVTGSKLHVLHPAVPAHAAGAAFSGVSCTGPDSCLAVGGQLGGSTTPALAESWNGQKWRVLATPNPANAADSSLGQVSCVSAARCFAVGSVDYFNRTGVFARNLVWTGGRWRAVRLTGRQPHNPALSAASCTRAFTCLAVGVNQSARPFAQIWNGTSLRPSPARLMKGFGPTWVDCTSAAHCIAVGLRDEPGLAFGTAAELWNGHTWRSLAPASP
jgi:hypothetical protein